MIPQSSLLVLGQAAFFASMLTFMVPTNMPLSIFVLANLMIVVGSCLGWAWGCAAMAAALRARDQVLVQQQIQKINSQPGVSSDSNPEQSIIISVFEGGFLDTRSTVVTGVFFILACYLSAFFQASRPKLKIAMVFFVIVLDIMCTYGPLFPTQRYTLATIFMIPIGCSLAISLAGHFLIFPESLSYGWQLQLSELLSTAGNIVDAHHSSLSRMAHVDKDNTEADRQKIIEDLHLGLVQIADTMEAQKPFLELEVTYGRFSPSDLSKIFASIRTTGVRIFGLNAFFRLLETQYCREGTDVAAESSDKSPASLKKDQSVTVNDTHTLLHLGRHLNETEKEHDVDFGRMTTILYEATDPLLEQANESLRIMSEWVEAAANRKRSYNHDEWVVKLNRSYDCLKETSETFINDERLRLIKPYEHMFVTEEHGIQGLTGEARNAFRDGARPLFICFVFAANLTHFAQELVKFQNEFVGLAHKRKKNRVWFPTNLRKLAHIINSRSTLLEGNTSLGEQSPLESDRYGLGIDTNGEASATSSTHNPNKAEEDLSSSEGLGKGSQKSDSKYREVDNAERQKRDERTVRMDPDALPPSNIIHHVGMFLSASYRQFYSPEGVFALKFAIVSFALWIPAVLPSSAGFVYHNRGVWALIMAQTGLAITGGEFVFVTLSRVIGTALGLVLGMLYWYISCGMASRGNPYGLGAVTAVGFIPLVYLRLFAPASLLMFTIMLSVTTVLCIGYSWIDANLPVTVNSGIGYHLAWKRALLVMIGIGAAFIISIFPRPTSTRRLVRQGFYKNTRILAQLYSSIIEGWIVSDLSETTGDQSQPGTSTEKHDEQPRVAASESENKRMQQTLSGVRSHFLNSQTILVMLKQDIGLAMFDLSFRGKWPKDKYTELHDVHARMLQALAQMTSALIGLDISWRRKLVNTSAILDPLLISDVSVTLSLLATSLRTGDPLPHAYTSISESAFIHRSFSRTIEERLTQRQEANAIYSDMITLDMLRDPQFMKHTAGVMAVLQFVRQLDRFRSIVSQLVGETDLPGYDHLKTQYDKRLIDSMHWTA